MLLVKIFTLHLFLTLQCANGVRTIMIIDRLEICNQSENNAMILNSVNIVYSQTKSALITANLTVTRDLRDNLHILVEVTRCMSQEALDTCQPYTVMNPLDSCTIVYLPHMAWTEIINAVRPPIKCPPKKGEYILKDAAFNSDLFTFFPFGNYYWRVKMTLFDGPDIVTVCGDFRVAKRST